MMPPKMVLETFGSKLKRLNVTRDAMVDDVDKPDPSMELHSFVRPGRHHFFFIRSGKHFMLSSGYPVEKYKETNIQMNYIDVGQRDWQISTPMVERDTEWRDLADIGEEGETSFDKTRSVFKNFKIDSP